MGARHSEVGGGPATGLADDFVNFLQQGITTGSFGGVTAGQQFGGADPMGSSMGMAGVLNDILSGGAGQLGGSLLDLMRTELDRNVGDVRARFGAGGGASRGTPAAFAESLLRSEHAPRATQAIGGLQLSAIQQLMPIIAGLAGRGISQRENIATPNPWASAASIAAPIISAGLGAFGGPPGMAAGAGLSNLFQNATMPQFNMPPMPQFTGQFGTPGTNFVGQFGPPNPQLLPAGLRF